ncbi:glycosyltransferase family 2 protein [Rhodoflexus sp.]
MIALFWFCLLLIGYTYVGYGALLWLIVKVRRYLHPVRQTPLLPDAQLPTVSFIVAAYNEQDYIVAKANDTLLLDYPQEKLQIIFVTDGSTDNTPTLLRQFSERIMCLHKPERAGKIAAVHRAMQFATGEICIFTDANTMLNRAAIREIVKHYQHADVGAVAGEKRVADAGGATAGEGIYWKYESFLKCLDYELYSVVGAAGELFSIRRELYEAVPPNTLLDDFMISMRVAAKGYRVAYAPEAYALESASANIGEEMKRKIRISAGGIQSIVWLAPLLNIFRYGRLSFQYISHRVLRWSLTPVALLLVLPLNWLLWDAGTIYQLLLAGQAAFYTAVVIGWLLAAQNIKIKAFFIPFYFAMMNYCVFLGLLRYLRGRQSVLWEKAKRG